ncbi:MULTISPECIES: efflux RND transporter periplasmic adaptor subunit [Cellulophaga]|uniref:Efflux transporter, RND family, MFP subunit n=1 Tax=Cellulophaga lytica (strain ATCC 23178 / DSM 7489 / JCM 8516 / NBRC 14961 / NCIMB 1423 / VKM B-1433 / Cy l20) TaxID=867900 RepID=F0RAU7_CELLC|nr:MULTISPECIES: efflux RND transporter periplasmic adaptor subunit [Cellulophaga]ADY29503.1 efflux transporter, RND family, MFP subunit [Cellulophaga lytica DSM 7489]APU10385.1 efflux transporter periplasmic adaptor subunit [Cellulophaga lytica]TVZ07950.1 RND family efflux transporter MFP subunit [Cellulophaga sp. RHA_52]WQG76323.1 efflux RND transporter periplasmic adaptor subunit [Cellulophaga lytica]
MKKIFYILTLTAVVTACGSKNNSVESIIAKGDIEAIREKKATVSEEHKKLEMQMFKLDSAIAEIQGNKNLPLVSTLTTKNQVFNHFLELQGNVQTKQNVLIYPEMAGTLKRVYVKEGQKVNKGQILATIDDGGMSSQLAQLKTQAELAKTTYERQQRLWEQKIGSEIQYLQAKTNYEAQVNAIKQAESQLGKSSIRAPFTGIIDDVIKEQGTVVAPGMGSEVFRIVNLSNMYLDVEVPETYIKSIKNGKEAVVYFPILNDSVVTKVRQTGNFINPSNRSFVVEIPVPNKNGNIKPNLTAKVRLNDYTSNEAILIPQSVISENANGEQYVYVAEKTEENYANAKKKIITTGKSQGPLTEVVSGLTANEHVIKEGARTVKDGQKVEILNQ